MTHNHSFHRGIILDFIIKDFVVKDFVIKDVTTIGGADGPTAILIASSFDWVLFAAAGVLVIGVVLFFVFKKRKK